MKRYLAAHEVSVTADLGWDRLRNGDLQRAAEKEGYEVFSPPTKTFVTSKSQRTQHRNRGHRPPGFFDGTDTLEERIMNLSQLENQSASLGPLCRCHGARGRRDPLADSGGKASDGQGL